MAISITAKVEGFRRCGVVHSMAETRYPEEWFTEEQWAILRAEPMLIVREAPDSPAATLSDSEKPAKRKG
jgi:hypothetical protein